MYQRVRCRASAGPAGWVRLLVCVGQPKVLYTTDPGMHLGTAAMSFGREEGGRLCRAGQAGVSVHYI